MSAGSDVATDTVMAEVEQRQSREMEMPTMLDTTMSETTPVDLADWPLPQTPLTPTPTSQPQVASPTSSNSDYSGSSSPTTFEPASSRAQSSEHAFEEISLADSSQSQRHSDSQHNLGEASVASRPVSEQRQSGSLASDEVEEPQSPIDSGSDYSEPSTPQTSRPTSIYPAAGSESMPVEDNLETPTASTQGQLAGQPEQTPTKKPSQQWNSLTQINRNSGPSDLRVDTSPRRQSNAESQSTASQPQTPSIMISSEPQSPDGSNYSSSAPQSPKSPSTPIVAVSPMTPAEAHMSIDSLQSIALSDFDDGYDEDYDNLSAEQIDAVLSTPRVSSARHLRKPSSLEILQNAWGPPTRPVPTRQSTFFDNMKDEPLGSPTEGPEESEDDLDTTAVWRTESSSSSIATPKRDSGSSLSDVEVDWYTLDKTEEQEKEDKDLPVGAEDESTAFLLARLEQENAKFTADPKSAVNTPVTRIRGKSRPPSMAHLKKLVSKRNSSNVRFSLTQEIGDQLPEDPPPMTELEFWTALVQDYPSTASRLPTLTTTKIRAGIPPPLRGVVWTSMAGARDKNLGDVFEKLQHENSPYEGIINKDIGRSFPTVALFRDADGEGQKMLGKVLKCLSLHDKDLGYCQGLGFLVGPLLMNMGEKDAFCVLVRLMEHYALRASFLPSLSGLHMRIFQFSTLLKQHHPVLFEHLAGLGVEPAYLSQWFLSCFAVTCPLPMLFRIYDVIFAEGANETVMRVALALFRRNEQTMLESNEFEEVMQLLLGTGIWDAYGCDADELVDDFTSLGNIITHQRLNDLEREFESKDGDAVGQSAGFLPDVQAAASRFLGRLWAPTYGHTPSKSTGTTLSPASADKEGSSIGFLPRGSFLRRSPSKTSIGTINESSGSESAHSTGSMASTTATETEIHNTVARESQAESMSADSKAESLRAASQAYMPGVPGIREQQELHTQIEDLLMAIGEMQREHAQMTAMLAKEREERNDDHRAVRQLIGKLQDGADTSNNKRSRRSMPPVSRRKSVEPTMTTSEDKRRTLPARPRPQLRQLPALDTGAPEKARDDGEVDLLIQDVQSRLDTNSRFSASFETRAQLRTTLAKTREQLASAETKVKDLSERAESSETSVATFQGESESLRSEVEELRGRVNDDFKEKQKLELTIENMQIQMRMEAKALEKKQRTGWLQRADSSGDVPTMTKTTTPTRSREGSISSTHGSIGGLRELKLARRDSIGSVQSIRSMKSQRQNSGQWPTSPPALNFSPSVSPPTGEAVAASAPPPEVPASASIPPPSPRSGSSHTPTQSLSVPRSGGFHPRTSSLATKEVLSTPAHETLPDEALLLELVNAKTSEAQARAELDELRKSLQVQKRRADEALLRAQAEAASAKLETEAAKAEAEQAKEDAKAARAEVFDASPLPTPFTPYNGFVTTPIQEDGYSGMSIESTPARKPEPRKADTAPPSATAGWFWQRRTASTTKAVIEDK